VQEVTNAIMSSAQAAPLQAGQVFDPFGNYDQTKDQSQAPQGQPGIDFTSPETSVADPAVIETAAPSQEKEQDQTSPFEAQNAPFETFGVSPEAFGSQPVETAAAPTEPTQDLGMNFDLSQAAQPSVQEQGPQVSTEKSDREQAAQQQEQEQPDLSPTSVQTVSFTQAPASKGDRENTVDNPDPFGNPEVFDPSIYEPSPAPAQVASVLEDPMQTEQPSPQTVGPSVNVFDPSPMNPAAQPTQVASMPEPPMQTEQPSPQVISDPNINVFDPSPMNPTAQPVEIAQAPQQRDDQKDQNPFDTASIFDPNSPTTSFSPQGQPQGQPSVAEGLPEGQPSSQIDIGGAGGPVVLPGQRLAMLQEAQRQKEIKAKRDAIAEAMMRGDPNQMSGIV
jgi:hypothetical protein